jgi:hypothetical protein
MAQVGKTGAQLTAQRLPVTGAQPVAVKKQGRALHRHQCVDDRPAVDQGVTAVDTISQGFGFRSRLQIEQSSSQPSSPPQRDGADQSNDAGDADDWGDADVVFHDNVDSGAANQRRNPQF